MMNVSLCPVCGGTELKPFLTTTDFTLSKEEFSLVECSVCNLVITSPRPETIDLGKYYQSNDYISHTSKANTLADVLYLIARKFTLRSKRKLVNNLQQVKGNLLDIGCGTGDFLATCRDDGWKVYGVEPNESAALSAKQKGIQTIETLDKVSGSFQLITLWHVLEHIPDLNETLQKIRALLSPDGVLLIAVPNHSSADGKTYKEYWAGFDVPRHLWHFNQQNMEQLLSKNSLTLQKTLPLVLDAFYVSLLSEAYQGRGVIRYFTAFITGLKSNWKARKTKEYSSLIYISTK
jgi:2-polyprenyl-3-methyl-5-hydroxy-6-metoxy-1,4-benzoquinol methylase